MPQDRLLTSAEAAVILGIDEAQVQELADAGDIPYYKIGGTFLRFKQSHIDQIKAELSADACPVSVRPEAPAAPLAETNLEVMPAEDSFKITVQKPSLSDGIKDFWHFYDFYIISLFLAGIIIYVIFRNII